MRILYYDCFSGISGDMNLAAMIDLGVEPGFLTGELEKLGLDGYELMISTGQRMGISGTRVDVVLTEHHHHGHDHEHGHSHEHIRTYRDIIQLIDRSSLSEKVKETSRRIFRIIGEAEAKIHNINLQDIHFHEVGAVDSIVDIAGAAICFHALEIDRVMAGRIELGGGFVKTAHGILPVPAPATAEILRGAPVSAGKVEFETTTPTGAAILAALVSEFTESPSFKLQKTAYGVGHTELEIPNLLRVYLGEEESSQEVHALSLMLECNIDDMNPEIYSHVSDLLFAEGAEDVFYTPIIMKKGRPATRLSVLLSPDKADRISEILFRETTTLGVRRYRVEKEMLSREEKMIETKYGLIPVKIARYRGQVLRAKPGFDACSAAAMASQVPLQEVYRELNRILAEK